MVTKFLYITSAFLISASMHYTYASSDMSELDQSASKKLTTVTHDGTINPSKTPKKPLGGVIKLTKGAFDKGHKILDKGVDGAAQFTASHLLSDQAKERVRTGESAQRLHKLTKIEKRATQGAQIVLAGGAVATLLLGQPEIAGALGIGAGAAGALTITSNAQESLGNKWFKKLQKALDKGDHESATSMLVSAQESNLITIAPVVEQNEIQEDHFPSLLEVKETLSNVIETVSPILDKVEDRLPEGGLLSTVLEKVSPVLDALDGKDASTPSSI